MSLAKSAAFLPAVVGLFGLGFTLAVHQYSKGDTARRLAELKPVEEIAAAPAPPPLPPDMIVPAGDPEKGRMTYGSCTACHGKEAEGGRMFNSPRLAGQPPWYMYKQLRKFKDGVRGTHSQDVYGMQMAPMAKLLYKDEIIANVIAYIGTLSPEKPVDGGPGDAAKGQALFKLCSTCHGADAQGNPQQKAPKLAGQHAWYLAKQLSNFKAGIRGSHEEDAEGKLMHPMAQSLNDQQAIDNVIAYIQSLGDK